MAIIRAKVYCQSVKKDGENEQLYLHPVYDEENKSWSQWTPAGSLNLTINNPAAQGKIEQGKTYYLDLIEAPAMESEEKKP